MNDNSQKIEGYDLVRADHPNYVKRGGVCIYYRESLPVRVISIPYLKEAVLLELVQNNNKIFVSVVYRSPSQTNTEFNQFLLNFEKMLQAINQRKPYLTVVTGDFSARSSSWWSDDINTTEGTKLLSLTSCNGFQQIINEPTHIQRQSSSCIQKQPPRRVPRKMCSENM